MLKKITGLLILIIFLLIKSTPLFAADQCVQKAITNCVAHDTEDSKDTEKETKQFEITDEDLMVNLDEEIQASYLSEKLWLIPVPGTLFIHIALPYPPPNPGI